ncbi:HepT-like ribonuclease domain-containing protein [Neorhizobium sp. LjRoot104]|uniref:HepT-like ribonuclease domain-containing protein n=1 Tax=Neorhizobium sp. LjRoot104 TaxID=3342254 RepID=UPI003ECF0273
MSSDRLREYLDQMHSAALQACDFVAGMEQEAFLADVRTQMAVGMALILIGESAARIMTSHPDFPVDHPEIPWSKIKGMRNFVVHDYYELELPIVLHTVRTSLPALVAELDSLRNWRAQGE